MAQKTITLFSIATTVVVLVIAIIVLLIGNYTKNFASGIALDHQLINPSVMLTNESNVPDVWIATSAEELRDKINKTISGFDYDNNLIAGIVLPQNPNARYDINLDSVLLRGSRININYRPTTPEPGQFYAEVITYPQLYISISREALQPGIPLTFSFNDLATGKSQTVNQTLTL